MPYTFALLFLWNKENTLTNRDAIAHVSLGSHTTSEYKGHEAELLLSSRCMTWQEFEHEVGRLRQELDGVARIARRRFAERDEFVRRLDSPGN